MNPFRRVLRGAQFVRAYIPWLLILRKIAAENKVDYSDFLEKSIGERGDRPALIGRRKPHLD